MHVARINRKIPSQYLVCEDQEVTTACEVDITGSVVSSNLAATVSLHGTKMTFTIEESFEGQEKSAWVLRAAGDIAAHAFIISDGVGCVRHRNCLTQSTLRRWREARSSINHVREAN
jgi:hypothetical protein